ncbi:MULTISPECIES: transglutaminase-like cysteine peptidase [Methylobacter]|uniref:transglutaminase-like cysteine peptidase n=1 Tax=Methylobacter TaxID=429 RepID=UPI001E4D6610|nr:MULTISPECIES: transglutaminase-like cysteine peptidase [Methylobacter]
MKKIAAVLLCWSYAFAVAATLEISDELLGQVQNKYGEAARQRIIQWQTLVRTAKDLPDQEKLQRVNEFFNQNIAFVDDILHWGVEDYWATPLEALATGAGDCEDYSIAKYFTLKELGVDEDKMRITYVKAYKLNQAHMVLTYFATPRAVPVVLDNLVPTIEPATKRTDLLPVYSFNGAGLWLAKARGAGQRVGGSDRLDLWTRLKQRMMNNPL